MVPSPLSRSRRCKQYSIAQPYETRHERGCGLGRKVFRNLDTYSWVKSSKLRQRPLEVPASDPFYDRRRGNGVPASFDSLYRDAFVR
jgi:hypothetical protein